MFPESNLRPERLALPDQGSSRYLAKFLTDISGRLHLEARQAAATHEHLGFQRLMSDLASRFAGVEPDGLDAMIADGLQEIAEALQLDRAILWQWDLDHATAFPALHWVRPSQPAPVAYPVAKIPFTVARLEAGEIVTFSTVDELPDPFARETCRSTGVGSAAALLLAPADEASSRWILSFGSTTARTWAAVDLDRLRLVAGVVSQALTRRTSQRALQQALGELEHLRSHPGPRPVERPREREVTRTGAARLIVSDGPAVRGALAQVDQVAATPATVLLRGETGAGKEVFAQAIHDLSPRYRRPMVVVNCAAIPTALIESELFGHERGAYTGAIARQIGRFEAAHQSTLFLDEVGDLPAEMQVKILRVLQDRVIERLGSTQPIKVDVRIIAATHRDLEKAVLDGAFREDLFYRLNVFPITVPPLRERVEDIPGLVWAFVDEFSRAFGKTIESISHESMAALQRYPWPGNVRELRNVIERALILVKATDRQLVVAAPTATSTPLPQTAQTLVALEASHIRAVLESTTWRVRGRGGAAERLGLKPTTLESRMARLGIVRKKTV